MNTIGTPSVSLPLHQGFTNLKYRRRCPHRPAPPQKVSGIPNAAAAGLAGRSTVIVRCRHVSTGHPHPPFQITACRFLFHRWLQTIAYIGLGSESKYKGPKHGLKHGTGHGGRVRDKFAIWGINQPRWCSSQGDPLFIRTVVWRCNGGANVEPNIPTHPPGNSPWAGICQIFPTVPSPAPPNYGA